MSGRAFQAYRAPLLVAWQLTNRCDAHCLACCEESGPDRGWRDELTRDEATEIAGRIVAAGVPYVVFGGGEPFGVAHFWDLLEILSAAGVSIKIETNGHQIDDLAAERLAAAGVACVQISVDGATSSTHEQMRPGARFEDAVGAIERLAARGLFPEMVFAPTRLNLGEIGLAYELAATLRCAAFITGPLMRLGRAGAAWGKLACSDDDWRKAGQDLQARRDRLGPTAPKLSIYPWDILEEMERRLESPQAMLLVVPNGKVKLLNALPFVAADLRRDSFEEAWSAYRAAWRAPAVRTFIAQARRDPARLRHANELWSLELN